MVRPTARPAFGPRIATGAVEAQSASPSCLRHSVLGVVGHPQLTMRFFVFGSSPDQRNRPSDVPLRLLTPAWLLPVASFPLCLAIIFLFLNGAAQLASSRAQTRPGLQSISTGVSTLWARQAFEHDRRKDIGAGSTRSENLASGIRQT